ncbi:MAG TPA: hypothetical protein VJG48_02985 [Candidatus Paceibacterota bacterium]
MKILLNKFFVAFAILVLPLGASAKTITDIIKTDLTGWLNDLVVLVVGVAVLVFIWGLVVFIAKSGDETARAEGKQKMIWGIIALFVMVSVWGIVRLISESFLGAGDQNSALKSPGLPK